MPRTRPCEIVDIAASRGLTADRRALSPAIGAVLLVGVTVVAASLVGVAVLGQASAVDDAPRHAALSMSVEGDRIRLVHEGGDTLDVRRLDVTVTVDDEPLRHQPPVPFFSARGFRPGPTGPFNAAADPTWTAGEAASFRVAGTNAPTLSAGATVTVRVAIDGRLLAREEARVKPG